MSGAASITRRVLAGGRAYDVVDDITTVYSVLAHGSVKDAVTGAPLDSFTVRVGDGEGVQVKPLAGGLVCLAGVPEQLIPGFPQQGKNFVLSVEAPGFRPATRTVTIAANAGLPVASSPIALRPLPVRIQGGVVTSATDKTPVKGARVVLTGPNGRRDRLGVGTPFGSAYTTAGPLTRVRGGTLSRSGTARKLTRPAAAGSSVVEVNSALSWTGPAPQLLAIGATRELPVVLTGGAAAGPVTLAAPLKQSFPAGTTVQAASFTAATGASPAGFSVTPALTRAVEPGDSFVQLAAAEQLTAAADAIAIPDAPVRREYATVGSVTDDDGYYAFASVSDVGRVELGVAGSAVAAERLTIDYGRPVNLMDLRQQ